MLGRERADHGRDMAVAGREGGRTEHDLDVEDMVMVKGQACPEAPRIQSRKRVHVGAVT